MGAPRVETEDMVTTGRAITNGGDCVVSCGGTAIVVDTRAVGHKSTIGHHSIRDRTILIECCLQVGSALCITISHVGEVVPVLTHQAGGEAGIALGGAWRCLSYLTEMFCAFTVAKVRRASRAPTTHTSIVLGLEDLVRS